MMGIINNIDVGDQMATDFMDTMEQVINERQGVREKYFILVGTNRYGFEVKTGINILREADVKNIRTPLIGTMLFAVDNRIGQVRMVWCLPPDVPLTRESYTYAKGELCKEVLNSALMLDAPLIHA